MRRPVLLVLALALALLAGCGKTEVVREPGIVVSGGAPRATAPAAPDDAVRIAVVTHGQASSPFWAIVRNGVEAAGRQMDVLVDYQAPEVYDIAQMRRMIDEAIAANPDGLVVSVPEEAVARSIRRAVREGIPVVSINSGSRMALALGTLAHVGQPEERSGLLAGRKLAASGVRNALCINQQVGNAGTDARCRGLSRALRAAGGRALTLGVDDQSSTTVRRIANALEGSEIDGVLAANATTGVMAADAVELANRTGLVTVGTFDLGPEVLGAVVDGRIAFAIDQQPYLQGYWPVTMLAQHARYGLLPEEGEMVSTGPNFVDTAAEAKRALELSRRSIR
jgi:simple sugar transport system substrate-binding protein